MKTRMIFFVVIASVQLSLQATIGSRIDAFVDKAKCTYERVLLDMRLSKFGDIPALSIENIKQHPEYKHEYIKYAAAHCQEIDPLILAALAREYPVDIAKHSSDALKNKIAQLLKK